MIKNSRRAKTGPLVTAAFANKHPSTTVTERRKSMRDKMALRELAIADVQMSLADDAAVIVEASAVMKPVTALMSGVSVFLAARTAFLFGCSMVLLARTQ